VNRKVSASVVGPEDGAASSSETSVHAVTLQQTGSCIDTAVRTCNLAVIITFTPPPESTPLCQPRCFTHLSILLQICRNISECNTSNAGALLCLLQNWNPRWGWNTCPTCDTLMGTHLATSVVSRPALPFMMRTD
jgi:hypothetical protein